MKLLFLIQIFASMNINSPAVDTTIQSPRDTVKKTPDTVLVGVPVVIREQYDTAYGDIIWHRRNGPLKSQRGFVIAHSRVREAVNGAPKQGQLLDVAYFYTNWTPFRKDVYDFRAKPLKGKP